MSERGEVTPRKRCGRELRRSAERSGERPEPPHSKRRDKPPAPGRCGGLVTQSHEAASQSPQTKRSRRAGKASAGSTATTQACAVSCTSTGAGASVGIVGVAFHMDAPQLPNIPPSTATSSTPPSVPSVSALPLAAQPVRSALSSTSRSFDNEPESELVPDSPKRANSQTLHTAMDSKDTVKAGTGSLPTVLRLAPAGDMTGMATEAPSWAQVYTADSPNAGRLVYLSEDQSYILYQWTAEGPEQGWWLGRAEDGPGAERALAFLSHGWSVWVASRATGETEGDVYGEAGELLENLSIVVLDMDGVAVPQFELISGSDKDAGNGAKQKYLGGLQSADGEVPELEEHVKETENSPRCRTVGNEFLEGITPLEEQDGSLETVGRHVRRRIRGKSASVPSEVQLSQSLQDKKVALRAGSSCSSKLANVEMETTLVDEFASAETAKPLHEVRASSLGGFVDNRASEASTRSLASTSDSPSAPSPSVSALAANALQAELQPHGPDTFLNSTCLARQNRLLETLGLKIGAVSQLLEASDKARSSGGSSAFPAEQRGKETDASLKGKGGGGGVRHYHQPGQTTERQTREGLSVSVRRLLQISDWRLKNERQDHQAGKGCSFSHLDTQVARVAPHAQGRRVASPSFAASASQHFAAEHRAHRMRFSSKAGGGVMQHPNRYQLGPFSERIRSEYISAQSLSQSHAMLQQSDNNDPTF